MRLKINNFRQHENTELNLPDNGLVLIKGPSGVGKTTIFDAIDDALYGEQKSTKPWSGGSPQIELDFAGLSINKTRTPNTLVVDNAGHKFKDEAALEEIKRVLGMTYDEFSACSYVHQGFANSLLDLAPADKMRFIQKLSSKKIDPEITKDKIKEQLKKRTDEYNEVKIKYDQLIAMADEPRVKLNKPTAPVAPIDPDKFQACKDKLKELQNDISDKKSKIASIEAVEKQKEKALAEKEELSIKVDALKAELDALPEPWNSEKREELNELKNKLFAKTDYLNKFSKLTALATRVHEKFADAATFDGKLSVYIHHKLKELSAEVTRLTTKMAETRAAITETKKKEEQVLDCPECKAKLKMDGDVLVKHDAEVKDARAFVEQAVILIKELESQRSDIEENVDFLKNIAAEANSLKASMPPKDPAPEYRDILTVTGKVTEVGNEIEKHTKEEREHFTKKTEYKSAFNSLEATNKRIEESTEDAQPYKDALVDLETRLASGQELCEKISKYELEAVKFDAELKAFMTQAHQIDELMHKLHDAEHAVISAEVRLGAAKRLKERADFAASSAIESKINDINASTAHLIDQMFADDGTVIQLSGTTTVGKGSKSEERAKIGVDVFHKGQKPKDIKPFSGGEKSRACLCFQLGLSEMYNSPILMIDEGFTGLNDELKEECLGVLKEAASNKLIIVIEHGVPEAMFDEVIEL